MICLVHRTRLLSAIGVSLCSVVVAGSQAAPAAALSAELRAHVQGERFGIVTSIRGLPLGVRYALQKLFGSDELDIAETGAEFQANTVVGNSKLPTRRLIAAGCSYDHCLVHYERGGSARYEACGAVSLDTGGNSIRMGRYRTRRPGDNR